MRQRAANAATQAHIRVREEDGAVGGNRDIVRPIEVLALEVVRQHGASAVLFQPLDREILTGTPDQAAFGVNARAPRTHQDHMGASYLGELAGVREVLAAVSSPVEEYRHLAGGCYFVDDVVDDAAGQQIAWGAVALPHPDRAVDKTKARGNGLQFRIRRDEGIQCWIRSGDAE